jgi:hypothetical protein
MSWLEGILLESPVPRSNWLPSRAQRLAGGRIALRRRFGKAGGTASSYRLRHLGREYPLVGGSRIVTGDEIDRELERDITTINPPVIQGWAAGLLVIAAVATAVGLASFLRADTLPIGLTGLLGPLVLWAVVLIVAGFGQSSIELLEDGVHLRRWTDVWLRRRGRRVGSPEQVHATLASPTRLVMTGTETLVVGMRAWPPSARADLVDELPLWGVACDFGKDPHRHRDPGLRSKANH